MASDHREASTPGRRRRSWFDPRESLAFDIDKPTRMLPSSPEDGDMEELILTHFTKPPRIDFGCVNVGKEKTRYLRVKNPNDFEQRVIIEKFPFKKHISVSQIDFTVNPFENVILTIVWSPKEASSMREMVLLKIDSVYRLQAYIFGKSEEPKPKKGKRGIRKMVSCKTSDDPSRHKKLQNIRSSFRTASTQYEDEDKENICQTKTQSPTHNGRKFFLQQVASKNGSKTIPSGRQTKHSRGNELVVQADRMHKFNSNNLSVAGHDFHEDNDSVFITDKNHGTFVKGSPVKSELENEARKEKKQPKQHLSSGSMVIPEFPSLHTDDVTGISNNHEKDNLHNCVSDLNPEAFLRNPKRETFVKEPSPATSALAQEKATSQLANIKQQLDSTTIELPEFPRLHESDGQKSLLHDDVINRDEMIIKRHGEMKTTEAPPPKTVLSGTPLRRETYVKTSTLLDEAESHPAVLTSPAQFMSPEIQRKTFEKDDPALPMTPLRRTTFMKARAAMPDTPVIDINSPEPMQPEVYSGQMFCTDVFAKLDGTPIRTMNKSSVHNRHLVMSPPIAEETQGDDGSMHLEDLAVDGRSRRVSVLPNKKEISLRDVSQSPQMLEERLKLLKETPDFFRKITPVSTTPPESKYCTAFTTPYESPSDDRSDADDVFEDSVSYQVSVKQAMATDSEAKEPYQKADAAMPHSINDVHSEIDGESVYIGKLPYCSPKRECDEEECQNLVAENLKTPCKIVIKVSAEVSRCGRRSWQPSPVIQLAEQDPSHSSSDLQQHSALSHGSPHQLISPQKETPVKHPKNETFEKDEPMSLQPSEDFSEQKHTGILNHLLNKEDNDHSFDDRIILSRKEKLGRDHKLSSTPADRCLSSMELFTNSRLVPSPITINMQTVTKNSSLSQLSPEERRESRKSLFSDECPSAENPRRFSTLTVTKSKPTILSEKRISDKVASLFPVTNQIVDVLEQMAQPLPPEQSTGKLMFVELTPTRKRSSSERNEIPTQANKRIKANSIKSIQKAPTSLESLKKTSMRKGLPVSKRSPQKRRSGGPVSQRNNTGPTTKPMKSLAAKTASSGAKPTAVKGLAKSKLLLIKQTTKTALPKHPLPFASKNMYYDEKWMEKEERGFTAWLNFVLTPPDENVDATKPQKINAGIFCNPQNPKLAPTKEVLSLRAYSARNRLNRLRRSACRLFQSDGFVTVSEKLEREIESGRLCVRHDRKLHTDLGIKQRVLELLLAYNPLWLRTGLETIYGEVITMQSNADVVGLSRFIVTRLLGNPDIDAQFCHPTVPHLYRDGYDEALAAFILHKFLLLVTFLDLAKSSRLMKHDPCLFCKDADVKSSRDLLVIFARDYMRGIGDITRHLSYLGFNVKHSQTPLDEYDFAVAKVSADLRDGVRLTRVVEMLTGKWDWSNTLRVPAISRLQKIHNVGLAFKALEKLHINATDNKGGKITERDIVDGHREKTLALLWNIIFNFQVKMLVGQDQLQKEVGFLTQNLRYKCCMEALVRDTLTQQPTGVRRESLLELYPSNKHLALLLTWCKTVCAHYGVKVENFTVSFSDGQALCYLVHHYHPLLLPAEAISGETLLTCEGNAYDINESADDSMNDADGSPYAKPVAAIDYEKLKTNEKENFRILRDAVGELGGVPFMLKASDMSSTIPDEKVVITFVTYLCSRLLDLRAETSAARRIQACWRRYCLKKQLNINKDKLAAVIVLQRAWRRCQAQRQAAREMARKVAAVKIQAQVRGYLARRRQEKLLSAAVVLQSAWRQYCLRRQYLKVKEATIYLQSRFRASKLASSQRKAFIAIRHDVTRLQAVCRGWLMRKRLRQERAATTIQAALRGFLQRSLNKRYHEAAVRIQAQWKAYRAVKSYQQIRKACCIVQTRYRASVAAKTASQNYKLLRKSAILIQRSFRGLLAHKHSQRMWAACILQASFKMLVDRKNYLHLRRSTVNLQSLWRMHQAKKHFEQIKSATKITQKYIRAKQLALKQRRQYVSLQKATIKIQRIFRLKLANRAALHDQSARIIQASFKMYKQKRIFLHQKQSATVIQTWCRSVIAKKDFMRLRNAVVCMQQRWRAVFEGKKARKLYMKKLCAVGLIQRMIRGNLARQHVKRIRAAIVIQSAYRMHVDRRDFMKKKSAAIQIQAAVRKHQCKSLYYRKKSAAVTIQHQYRATLAMRRTKQEFLLLKRKVVLIQSLYRGNRDRSIARRKLETKQLRKRSATVIQAWYRGVTAKQNYDESRRAALCIQRHWRAIQAGRGARKQYRTYLRAVVLAQCLWRRKQAVSLVKSERAARTIQASFRMYRHRKAYTTAKRAAVMLQSWYKMIKMRCQYVCLKNTTVRLQRLVRANIVARKQRQNFLKLKGVTICAQSMFRGYLARQLVKRIRAAIVLQSAYRMHVARRDFTKKKSAAIQIQAAVRKHQCKLLYSHKKSAAVTIQLQYRATLAMRKTKQEFLLLKRKVVLIQSLYRGNRDRSIARRKFEIKQLRKRSATVIQAWYRGLTAKQNYDESRRAALCIQRHWRAIQAGRGARKQYRTYLGAVVLAQCLWRRKQAVSLVKSERAARTIQASFRMYRQRKAYTRAKIAAVMLQSWYKMIKRRHQYVCFKNTTVRLQRLVRANIDARKQRQNFLKLKGVTICAQSMFRGYLARQLVKRIRAAIVLQSAYRMHVDRRDFMKKKSAAIQIQAAVRKHQCKSLYSRKKSAAVTIQHQYRATLAMRKTKQEFLLLKRKVVLIQSLYRGNRDRSIARRKLETKQLRDKSATIIQTWYRMLVKRQEYFTLKSTAVKLQRLVRANKEACKQRQNFLTLKGVVICAQSLFRGYLARRYVKRIRAAIVLQSAYRMQCARKEFVKIKSAVLVIQQRYRACLVQRKTHREFLSLKRNVIRIQSLFRGIHDRNIAKRKLETKKLEEKSATIIQTWYRCVTAKYDYNQSRRAALCIQKHWRAVTTGRMTRKQYRNYMAAVVLAQSRIRGYLARKQVRRCRAALVLQSAYRMHKARSQFMEKKSAVIQIQATVRMYQCMSYYSRVKVAALVIQQHYRAYLVMRQARQEFLLHKQVILIQSLYRGNRDRNTVQRIRASICLQRAWRSMKARHDYTVLRKAVITVQTRWRALQKGRTVFQEYRKLQSSAVIIQSSYRGFLVRRHMCRRKAAILVQSTYRSYAAQKRYKRVQAAALVIQRSYRCKKIADRCQFMYHAKRGAAIAIQSAFRRLLAQRLVSKIKASIVIQKQFRCYLAVKHYDSTKRKVTLAQSAVRCYLARTKYMTLLSSVRTLQEHWHATLLMRQDRKAYKCQRQAAVTIQSHFKAYQAQKDYHTMKTGFTRLQAVFKRRTAQSTFRVMKTSAVVIQRWYRAVSNGALCRQLYLKQKKSVVIIQSALRCWKVRKDFCNKRRAATVIQKVARALIARQKYLEMKKIRRAASVIQRCFRSYRERQLKLLRRGERLKYVAVFAENCLRHLAAIRIQRRYRYKQALKKAQINLTSVILIQRLFRAKLARLHFLRMKLSICTLQRAARAFLQCRENAARCIQKYARIWLEKRRAEKEMWAATVLQARWRGRDVRKRHKKMKPIRQRLMIANASATEEKKLGNRTSSALDYLLKYKQMAHILEAVTDLEVVTRLSPHCCKRMVSGNAVTVLIRLIRSCNRSIPHMEVIKYTVSILLNLSKYEETVGAVFNTEGCLDTLIEVMQIFREKGIIFNKTCTLLGLMCQHPERKQMVKANTKIIDKLKSLYTLTQRKYNMTEKRKLVQTKMAASKALSSSMCVSFLAAPKLPQIQPDWVLRRGSINELNDSLQAIKYVMTVLHVSPK